MERVFRAYWFKLAFQFLTGDWIRIQARSADGPIKTKESCRQAICAARSSNPFQSLAADASVVED